MELKKKQTNKNKQKNKKSSVRGCSGIGTNNKKNKFFSSIKFIYASLK
jgi:hypothetical protein